MRAPEATVRALAEHLADKGFLHRVQAADDDAPSTYTLSRAPEAIAVNDLYDLWSALVREGTGADDLPGEVVVERLEAARRDAFASLTLDAVEAPQAASAAE